MTVGFLLKKQISWYCEYFLQMCVLISLSLSLSHTDTIWLKLPEGKPGSGGRKTMAGNQPWTSRDKEAVLWLDRADEIVNKDKLSFQASSSQMFEGKPETVWSDVVEQTRGVSICRRVALWPTYERFRCWHLNHFSPFQYVIWNWSWLEEVIWARSICNSSLKLPTFFSNPTKLQQHLQFLHC